MSFRIGRQFSFSAAHHLAGLPEGHKCARPHGHTYAVEVIVTGEELAGPGFVTDFGDLKPLGKYIEAHLDHRDLNVVLDFPPTSEFLARHLAEWFMENVEPDIKGRLLTVRVSETSSTWAEFTIAARAAS